MHPINKRCPLFPPTCKRTLNKKHIKFPAQICTIGLLVCYSLLVEHIKRHNVVRFDCHGTT